jgi:hypothetical protein
MSKSTPEALIFARPLSMSENSVIWTDVWYCFSKAFTTPSSR